MEHWNDRNSRNDSGEYLTAGLPMSQYSSSRLSTPPNRTLGGWVSVVTFMQKGAVCPLNRLEGLH